MSPPMIVLAGLPWQDAGSDGELVRDMLEKGAKMITEAGYKYHFLEASPKIGIDNFTAYLKEHQDIDGICIGFGVRRNPELGGFMELLVDAIRQHSPRSKILFNSCPDSTLAAVQRWFPL